MNFLDVLNNQVYDFIVIFARTASIIAFAPILGAKNIPAQLKALLAFLISIIFTIFLSPLEYSPETTTAGLIIQLAGEASIGAAIGFAATLFFEIIIFAGYIIDYMIGFGFINIVDPQSGSSISIFAFFYSFLGLVLFLLIDGHHILIEVMLRSYELIPVFGADMSEMSMDKMTTLAAAIFYVGFQVAAPIFIVMFMIDFTLGMISKTVPQLQILVVGFPVKIACGLMAIGIVLKPTVLFLIGILESYRDNLLWLMHYWGSPP